MTKKSSANERLFSGARGLPRWIIVILFLLLAIIVTFYIFSSDFSKSPVLTQSPLASPDSTTSAVSPIVPTPDTNADQEATVALGESLSNLYEAGLMHYESGEFVQAIDSYNAALTLYPDAADVLNARGNAYLAMGDVDKALQDYNRAIELNSMLEVAYYNRGRVRAATGDYEEALQDFSFVVSTTPRLAYAALVNRGVVYFKMGNYDLALREYDTAINADPNQALAYLNKATTLMELEDLASAVDNYRRAREIDSRLGAAYWGEGWAYYKLEDYDASIEATKKAIDLIPDEATLYFNLGLAQLAGNYIEDSRVSYQTGIELATEAEREKAIIELETLKESAPQKASDIEGTIESLK